MKKSLVALVLASAGAMAGCCTAEVVKHPVTRTEMVSVLKTDTVALVHKDSDGDTMPYCAGVWVDKETILTANHCVVAAVNAGVRQDLEDHDDDATDEQIKALVNDREKDFAVEYAVVNDYTGMWREPGHTYSAKVVRWDESHDLALLKVVSKFPVHTVATVAVCEPPVGSELSVVGHPGALAWTYTRVLVSGYREENFKPVEDEGLLGPFMQLAGAVWKGNSGGGAFNEYGQLVGIASFMPPVPSECFFVHVTSIRGFLGLK